MNRTDIERSNYLVNAKKAFRLKYNSLMIVYLLVLVLGYAFFFSSKIWMPTDFSSVKATRYNSVISYGDVDFTLLSWDYSKTQDKMEIILSVNNKSLEYDTSFAYSAYYISKSSKKPVYEIINQDELIVLQLDKVPNDFGAVCIHMGYSDNSFVKIYATSDSVYAVDNIEEKTFNEYMCSELQRTISHYESLNESLKADIDDYTSKIEVANNKILELEEKEAHQTETEIQETQGEITKLLNAITTYNDAIAKDNDSINEYTQRIANLTEELKLYE